MKNWIKKWKSISEWERLKHPLFLLALGLLLWNDLYLKTAFGNFWTGKISDFAGLYVWVWFFMTLLPRFKNGVIGITVTGFIWWKSEYAQPFIDWWNAGNFWILERTIDFSDLWGLLVIVPALWMYKNWKPPGYKNFRWSMVPIIGITLVSFMATSRAKLFLNDEVWIHKWVTVKMHNEDFFQQLEKDGIQYEPFKVEVQNHDSLPGYKLTNIPWGTDTILEAYIAIFGRLKKTDVYIEKVKVSDSLGVYESYKEYNKLSKRYRVESLKYFKKLKLE